MCFPQSWGGAGLTSIEQILVLEELARGDTATAWCAMIGCDSGIYSGFLEEKSAKEIFPHANLAVAGWIHPQGKAEIVDGGYIVTGKWRFASGSPHGDVISAGCFLYRNGNLILDDNGKPLWRVMLARPADYLFSDTWFTTGLRGSGSQDYSTQGLFIPEPARVQFLGTKTSRATAQNAGCNFTQNGRYPAGACESLSGLYLRRRRTTAQTEFNDVKWRNSKRVQTAVANAENQLFITRKRGAHQRKYIMAGARSRCRS
ncbi:Flavin-dependent monooxygenase, oxygenase subunit HsaA [Raoultella planticola]|uniref:Flavin-dependent monooxygenase, oxygenase subunit HsaA n=1 Tax=Raoultella planticola TaxID=575 RepID=A0A485CRV2_RAOPL|nr:Flavin-dependent monooxygenase, oxygenase subunit HsaA [Raoultella planticola]